MQAECTTCVFVYLKIYKNMENLKNGFKKSNINWKIMHTHTCPMLTLHIPQVLYMHTLWSSGAWPAMLQARSMYAPIPLTGYTKFFKFVDKAKFIYTPCKLPLLLPHSFSLRPPKYLFLCGGKNHALLMLAPFMPNICLCTLQAHLFLLADFMANFWKTMGQTFSDVGVTNPPGAPTFLLPPLLPAIPAVPGPLFRQFLKVIVGAGFNCPLNIVIYRPHILGCSHPSPVFLRASGFKTPHP